MDESPKSTHHLADAVAEGDLSRVLAILDAKPHRLRETDGGGRGLLTVAAHAGHEAMVKLLLERGADPTWPEADAPRGAALYEAARTGRRDLVELLLGHGADPNTHVEASGNAVFAAARFPEVRALLEAHGGTLDPYDLVWLDEDDEVMRRVVANPESAHAGCGGVYTAVVTRRKRDLLMRLLDAGVRVPTKPCGCRSYLLEDADMLRLLLARGGLDPNYVDENGTTLLHALCRGKESSEPTRHRIECAEILLAAGADISMSDDEGLTPLELARRNDLPDLVALLSAAQTG